jgi:RHS repeat-associated protein
MDPAQWGGQSDPCTPQTTGPNGPDRVAKPTYDNANRVVAVTTAVGTSDVTTASTTYSDNGLVKTVKDGENNLTTNEYDGHDRLVKTRYPLPTKGANASSTTDFDALAYDPNGNVTIRTQRDGSTITFAYDNLDRVTSRTPQGESATTLGYNLLGQPVQVQVPAAGQTLAYTYDGLGRPTSETQPFGSAAFQYDLAGRTTRLTWSDGLYASYDYDNLGNVTAIRENGATSGPGVLATYSYDNLARRSAITRGNGTTTAYSFDPVSRLTSLSQDLSGTGSDLTIGSMAYNPAGQIIGQVKSNDAYAWTGAINVDRPYAANGLNQYSTAGTTSFGYDLRGNLTASGTSSYTYNKLNQLITAPGGITMAYDPAGRLMKYNAGGAAVRFSYAGSAPIQEADPFGTVLRRYVPGPGVDEPVVWYEGSGTLDRRWFHTDERGSVIAVSDGSGAMLSINRYDEYGIPQSTNAGRFQYTGQAWLPELGMYYYKARIYSPTMGRFMQTDPIGYGDGLNWYNYVGGDPVNGTDPSGLAILGCTGSRVCGYLHKDGSTSGGPIGMVSSSNGPSQGGSGGKRGGTVGSATTFTPGGPTTSGTDDKGNFIQVSGGRWSTSVSYFPTFSAAAGTSEPKPRCFGPPAGPKGITSQQLSDQAKLNGDEAAKHKHDLSWFYGMVKNKGQWDYKQHDRAFQNFGNYNYGYVGTRAGIPAATLRSAAGYAQIRARTSDWSFLPSAFDDPQDQMQINRGINDPKNGCLK